ncbi:MAG: hypothetical protein ACXABJ_10730, partial [Candidatus Heimdallarchaeaceae archaeon]
GQQPTLESIESTDLDPIYDEGFLHFEKSFLSLMPKKYIQYLILEYKSTGEPSWHRVVLQKSSDYYSAYICSAKSLFLEYRVITYIGEQKKPYFSGKEVVELVDLTPPTINVQFVPEVPEYGEAIHFYVEVFDSSGISKVQCLFTTTGDQWIVEEIQQENDRYRYFLVLVESIRLIFDVTDNNGYIRSSDVIEFLVLPNIDSRLGETSQNNIWIIIFSILGGITILSVSGYILLKPRVKLNLRRMVK